MKSNIQVVFYRRLTFKIQHLQGFLSKGWKPHIENLDDATCYESELRYATDCEKIREDNSYAGTENRDFCKENGIQISFVTLGRRFSDEKKEKELDRKELARVRATVKLWHPIHILGQASHNRKFYRLILFVKGVGKNANLTGSRPATEVIISVAFFRMMAL